MFSSTINCMPFFSTLICMGVDSLPAALVAVVAGAGTAEPVTEEPGTEESGTAMSGLIDGLAEPALSLADGSCTGVLPVVPVS